jgi:hypothetical protein
MGMKEKDKISSVFWLVLSFLILEESWPLPFGTISRPKQGFFPFLTGLVLCAFSLVFLVRSFLSKEGREYESPFFLESGAWKRIALTLASLLLFFILFEQVGFLLATFAMSFILIKFVEPQKWYYAAGVSLLISACCYILFVVVLKSDLPKGVLVELMF